MADRAVSHLRVDKPGGTTGEQDKPRNPGFKLREIKPQKKASNYKKTVGITVAAVETPSLTGEFIGDTQGVLECTQTYAPGNQHQKGPICL